MPGERNLRKRELKCSSWVHLPSRRVRFISSNENYAVNVIASSLSRKFCKHSILCDRDHECTSIFCNCLMEFCKLNLKMPLRRNCSRDGASEVMKTFFEKFHSHSFCVLFHMDNWDALLHSDIFLKHICSL